MYIKPFSDITTNEYISNQNSIRLDDIDRLTNEEIMSNDIAILTENIYQKFFIAPVVIYEEEKGKRSIEQSKTTQYVDPFLTGYSPRYCNNVDALVMKFYYSFEGEEQLFRCKASTFSLKCYPNIEIEDNYIVFTITKTINDVKHLGQEKIIQEVNESLDSIKQGIEYVNNDIKKYNEKLKLNVWKELNAKKANVKTYFDVSKMFEIQLEKNEYAKKHIPIKRNIIPIAHEFKSENYYDLKDSDYIDILESIKHTASTYERTPKSYKNMQEEDIRNTLLAALNATYKGNANGETFRNNGKTDICIEQENRAAFVAECKMWIGSSAVEKAIDQLDGYLTWRDCKTALIYFVRRKDFIGVLEKLRSKLSQIDRIKKVKEIDKNEFDCMFYSKSNPGQQIRVRVMIFNLYSE